MSDVAMAALDHDPRQKPDHAPTPDGGQAIRDWGLAIDAPLHVADADAHPWDEQADMVVVGQTVVSPSRRYVSSRTGS